MGYEETLLLLDSIVGTFAVVYPISDADDAKDGASCSNRGRQRRVATLGGAEEERLKEESSPERMFA